MSKTFVLNIDGICIEDNEISDIEFEEVNDEHME